MYSRPGDFSSAINPAAAITPAWRIPPPNIFRYTRPFSINARVPTIIDPTGPPNPFDKQNITESTLRVMCETFSPKAVAALNTRAPSRCTFNPASSALPQISSTCPVGSPLPPHLSTPFPTHLHAPSHPH